MCPVLRARVPQRGVTLTELLIALSLAMLTIGAIYTLHLTQTKQQRVQEDVVAMQQNVRAAMDLLGRELRMAGYDPRGVNGDRDPSNNFEGISSHPTELRIKADLNGNGRLTDPNESIMYVYDPSTSTLRRRTGAGGRQPVAENISSFSFTLLNARGEPTGLPAAIRMVEVTLSARTAHPDPAYPQNQGFRSFTLRSKVFPRNLE